MKWIKRVIGRWALEASEQLHNENIKEKAQYAIRGADVRLQPGININQAISNSYKSPETHSINFQIYPATGGHVIEIHFNDANVVHLGSHTNRSLHIVPSDCDLGDAISKIITLEMLKK